MKQFISYIFLHVRVGVFVLFCIVCLFVWGFCLFGGFFGYFCKNCQSIQLPCTERDCLTARAHEIHANIVNRSVIVDRGKVCETHSFNGKM